MNSEEGNKVSYGSYSERVQLISDIESNSYGRDIVSVGSNEVPDGRDSGEIQVNAEDEVQRLDPEGAYEGEEISDRSSSLENPLNLQRSEQVRKSLYGDKPEPCANSGGTEEMSTQRSQSDVVTAHYSNVSLDYDNDISDLESNSQRPSQDELTTRGASSLEESSPRALSQGKLSSKSSERSYSTQEGSVAEQKKMSNLPSSSIQFSESSESKNDNIGDVVSLTQSNVSSQNKSLTDGSTPVGYSEDDSVGLGQQTQSYRYSSDVHSYYRDEDSNTGGQDEFIYENHQQQSSGDPQPPPKASPSNLPRAEDVVPPVQQSSSTAEPTRTARGTSPDRETLMDVEVQSDASLNSRSYERLFHSYQAKSTSTSDVSSYDTSYAQSESKQSHSPLNQGMLQDSSMDGSGLSHNSSILRNSSPPAHSRYWSMPHHDIPTGFNTYSANVSLSSTLDSTRRQTLGQYSHPEGRYYSGSDTRFTPPHVFSESTPSMHANNSGEQNSNPYLHKAVTPSYSQSDVKGLELPVRPKDGGMYDKVSYHAAQLEPNLLFSGKPDPIPKKESRYRLQDPLPYHPGQFEPGPLNRSASPPYPYIPVNGAGQRQAAAAFGAQSPSKSRGAALYSSVGVNNPVLCRNQVPSTGSGRGSVGYHSERSSLSGSGRFEKSQMSISQGSYKGSLEHGVPGAENTDPQSVYSSDGSPPYRVLSKYHYEYYNRLLNASPRARREMMIRLDQRLYVEGSPRRASTLRYPENTLSINRRASFSRAGRRGDMDPLTRTGQSKEGDGENASTRAVRTLPTRKGGALRGNFDGVPLGRK